MRGEEGAVWGEGREECQGLQGLDFKAPVDSQGDILVASRTQVGLGDPLCLFL